MSHNLSAELRKLADDLDQKDLYGDRASFVYEDATDALRRAADMLDAVAGERDNMRAGQVFMQLKAAEAERDQWKAAACEVETRLTEVERERGELRRQLGESRMYAITREERAERAEARVAKLRKALEWIANIDNWLPTEPEKAMQRARQALADTGDNP